MSIPWYNQRLGLIFVGVFILLSITVGVIISIVPFYLFYDPRYQLIPPLIYLSSFLGAMAYVFFRLFKDVNMPAERVFQLGIRVPAALLLATGVYLVFFALSGGDFFLLSEGATLETTVRLVAGLSFMVGYYLTYAVQSLDATADQIFQSMPGGQWTQTDRDERDE